MKWTKKDKKGAFKTLKILKNCSVDLILFYLLPTQCTDPYMGYHAVLVSKLILPDISHSTHAVLDTR